MSQEDPGQLLLTGVPGTELDSETAERFRRIQPGGFIIFGRNIKSPEQLRKLIDDLRDVSEIEPIITIDQEGGRVSRLRLIGNEPPSAQQLREHGNIKLIAKHGELTGKLLRLFGFNLDLCPVLDISWNGDTDNSLLGRTWGLDPNEVIYNATQFNTKMRKQGILSCGKHFPGYGRAEVDAHHELPVINLTMEELEKWELLPFRSMLDDIDSMMIGHSYYPCLDPDKPRWPASLSHNVIQKFLKDQLGFKGLVMTDDLDMGAILNEVTFEETIRFALEAGNDMLMICHRVELIEEAMGYLKSYDDADLQPALERVAAAKKRLASPYAWSLETWDKLNSEVWDLRVETLGEEKARDLSVEDGKRSPVETY